jgi:23S rRNA pseudouridine1911/1915/1917 synthase
MDLESALKNYLAGKCMGNIPMIPYLGIIQRLDQPVEGVLVFAKTPEAAAKLSHQLTNGQIKKHYLAAVSCKQELASGMLEDYLLRDGRANHSRAVPKGHPGAKRAVLRYECVYQEKEQAILRIRLLTGRHHQIRVQLAHAGMPIAGDQKYNPSGQEPPLCLCAYKLVLYHPRKQVKLEFEIKSENSAFFRFFERNV